MGSRGRSIRLRIYFLVAIPLIAMVGLLAYVASTTVNNAINLDRAPDLINATSLPTAEFIKVLQDERADAVVYLFQPTPQNQAAYATAVKASQAFQPKFLAAMNSPGTKSSEDAAEAQAIKAIIGGLSQLPGLRGGVTGQALTPLQALGGYNAVILNEPRLFLAEANSLTNAVAAGQALGLIATVSAREALSQEYALVSGMLAGQRSTQADRAAFSQMVATRQGDIVDAESVLDQANLAVFNKQVNNDEQTQLARHRDGGHGRHPRRQAADHPGAVAGADGQAAQRVLHRWRQCCERPAGVRPHDQPVSVDQGGLHRRHRPRRAAPHHHGDDPGRRGASSAGSAAWSVTPSSSPRSSCRTWWAGSGAARTST